MVKRLMKKFKINHLLSTPYHPQTNGLVEQFNRTLCESLSCLSLSNNSWDLYIAFTLFAYRTTKHSTIKIKLFFLVYRRSAHLPIDFDQKLNSQVTNDHLLELIDEMPQVQKKVKSQVLQAQIKQKDRYDKKLKRANQFKIGEKVLYFNVTLDQFHSEKFNPKWRGPFIINQVLPHGTYKLSTETGQLLPTPINGNLLKVYHEPLFQL